MAIMEKPAKRIGRPSRYSEGLRRAVDLALRAEAPRPNRRKIAKDYGVGQSYVYRRWLQLEAESQAEPKPDGSTVPRAEGLEGDRGVRS